jgi:alanyl-tRNA synthetase
MRLLISITFIMMAAALVRSFTPAKRSFLGVHRRSAAVFSTSDESTDTEIEWSTAKVRQTFMDYFGEAPRSHTYQPSSACAPLNDPTLLFTNAGMNQFKPIFLGQVDPNSPLSKLSRACNSQKCIRAGGKHNDLEDVGRDTYHHTFFEMLGSWSFGDYFKKEAIDYAWELLTDVYKLDPERIYATYFEGDDNVEPDYQARDYWLKYLPEHRVIACGAADNFWEMGDVGPCGPASELHYDRIGGRDASALVNADDPDVIEIWNIVFIQYNREPDKLQLLPAQHIDTGMGLERLVSILQGKSSNYDIDCFQPLFHKIAEHSTLGPYTGRVGAADDDLKDTAYRAIADHARTLSFAIADGAVPNNEGRGYVLRRVLRRAARYGQQILGAKPGFFATLVPVVVETFGEAYPELVEKQDTIIEIVQEEEQAFSSMLDRGIKFFADLQEKLKEEGKTQVSGETAFFLYDTLGFPIDLTELMAEEAGLTVDSAGFAQEMQAQKQRSREAQKAARSGGSPVLELIAEQTAWLNDNGVFPTDDGFKYKLDVQLPATVMAVFGADGFLADGASAEKGDFVGLVVDKSSFYAEAGGQEADFGRIEVLAEDGSVTGSLLVSDVQAYGGFLLHKGTVEEGSVQVGTHVNCKVDYDRRRLVAPNHSMTHVLNAALRKVLGDGVDQRGSLCNDEKLRFDFSHKKAVSAKELKEVEELCQKAVQEAQAVTSKVMSLEEAKEIEGVRAVFGEVYPDPVRVVIIGDDTSVEFCGGTHLGNTAEAEAFVLVEETAVAKGIRRISAVTKDTAKQALVEGEKFKTLVADVEKLSEETPELDKQAGAMRKDLDAAFLSASLKAELRFRIEGIQKKAIDAKKKALQQRVDLVLNEIKIDIENALAENKQVLVLNADIGADAKASQRVINTVKDLAPEMAFLGLSEEEPGSGGKLMAFAFVPSSLVDAGFKADDWVRSALESCGGRGGGKPDNAQGQAKECTDVAAVLDAANAFAASKVEAQVM